jgi:acyl-CoA reductase-like NAD-dependent aldehyde dehydrogenase
MRKLPTFTLVRDSSRHGRSTVCGNLWRLEKREGATLLSGGPGRSAGLTRGYFVRPTVFSHVNNAMTIAREEIFGPGARDHSIPQ